MSDVGIFDRSIRMSESIAQQVFDVNTPEGRQTALNLDAYRQEIIQERWLSTLILSIHLELEAMLEVLIASVPSERKKHSNGRGATFSEKAAECSLRRLLEPKVISCLKAVNKLRNELAHRLDNKPTDSAIFSFIESMSLMHPLRVFENSSSPGRNLQTFAEIKEHFNGAEAENLEEFVFITLMLLRSTISVRLRLPTK